MIKKLFSAFVVIAFLSVIGCVGINIKPSNEALSVLQKSATSTVGYLIAKNNPDHIPDILKWYSVFQNLDGLVDVQTEYQNGMQKLAGLISDDPFLQLQIKNAMSMLEITVEGPMVPEELKQYRDIVDCFMMGVSAVKAS